MIGRAKTDSYARSLETAEKFLKPILADPEGFPTALLNRMSALANKLLLRVQGNSLQEGQDDASTRKDDQAPLAT